jgi:isopentenyl-diphosphate delta-isomerase
LDRRSTAVDEVVSFDSEQLILVDEQDREVGRESKADCHAGSGILHRAFSLFIFNGAGELLLQQRSPQKRLWPGFWSNSCCSHPRYGEDTEAAAHRRLYQELALTGDLKFLYKFRYQAQFGEAGAEHELCWVYIGASDGQVKVNANEISAWRFVTPDALDRDMAERPHVFTPWFKLEWERIRRGFAGELAAISSL